MWEFLIKNVRFTLLLMFILAMGGVLSVLGLPKESSPEVKVPFISIGTFYPGASPLDAESLITDPLEDRLGGLGELKNMSSFSGEGFSSIFLEFETSADIDEKVREAQDIVNQLAPQFPEGAFDPSVEELNFSNEPILILSVSTDESYEQLVAMADTLKSSIEEVSDVSEAEIVGVRKKQIQVQLNPRRLQQYGVSLFEVLSTLQNASTNLPLETVTANEKQYNVRIVSDLDLDGLEELIVRKTPTSEIQVKDLGSVYYDFEESAQSSRISVDGGQSEEAVTINVYKRTGGDIIKMVDTIFENIEELKGNELKSATVITGYDAAEDIRDQLNDLTKSGAQTIGLVFLILLVTLGFREAFVAGLSIPFTFFFTFIGLSAIGSSINFLSLFSLILALGILVDTGVVVVEGMHRRLARGESPRDLALNTVREYQWPLISGTMTTVAAFLPMLFMTGIIGEFVKHIPRTVTFTLFGSLFVGLGILPVLGSRLLKAKTGSTEENVLVRSMKASYSPILNWFLQAKRRQSLLMLFMFVLFAGSIALPATGALTVTMFPESDYRLFFIEVELPKGSRLEDTNQIVKDVEKVLLDSEEIESYTVNVGSSSNTADGVGALSLQNSNLANFSVNLVEDRDRSSVEIIEEYREEFADIEGADVTVVGLSEGPPSATPISFRIYGEDLDVLKAYADDAVEVLEGYDGTVNVGSSLDETVTEFVLHIDHEKVHEAGLDEVSLAQLMRLSSTGVTATSLSVDGKDTDVMLLLDHDSTMSDVLSLPIITPFGTQRLADFVDVQLEPAPVQILHTDGERSVEISSELDSGFLAADILDQFQEDFDDSLEEGYRLEFGGEAEEMAESFASLGQAMIFGMLLIIIILVLQFNSFKQAFIVMLTIPLALIGVFTGLTILGLPFSFPAFIGVVALAGIVVNNAIILIDRINRNLRMGLHKDQAILHAGLSRFQPILLTSVTTIAGILPLALSDPTWGPLGFAIISGLIFSTVLTLVVIPAAYMRLVKSP